MHPTKTHTTRRLRWLNVAAILAMLIGVLPFSVELPGPLPTLGASVAHAADDTLCYAVADDGDRLVTINRIDGDPQTDVGGLGVTQVEAVAWNVDATILYAANASRLGTINTSTGAFTNLPSFFGSGTGVSSTGSTVTISFSDVDGLGVDPTTGIMYGSHRYGDGSAPDDVLIQINLSTGQRINDAFAGGYEFVTIDTSSISATLNDVDDIAIDPTDGQMYGVANNSGGDDRLIRIDKATGAVTDVGRLREAGGGPDIDDMEGFSFYNDGTFYGTTGEGSELWEIDTATGEATLIGEFDFYGDYEAVACLTAGANRIEGTVFDDVNGNGFYNPTPDIGDADVTVSLYWDSDNDTVYETLVATQDSAGDGSYSFDFALTGDFRVVVDTGDYPGGHGPSTPTSYDIDFTGYDNTSTDNDFGYSGSTIGNYIWLDLDGQGDQDADEPGIPGIIVELDTGACTPGTPGNPPTPGTCPTTTTDADGIYSFPDLIAGTYQVNVLTDMSTLGLTQTYDPDEGPGTCTICNGNDEGISIGIGQIYGLADFGYVGSASIGDFVWDDESSDGDYDVGEAGINDVTVDLTWYGPNGVAGGGDDVAFTTTTNGAGGYDFTGLPSGNYSVDLDVASAPAGYVLTTSNDPLAVSVTTGQDYNDADFGLYRAPEAVKQLYFTTAGQGLDRVSPVDTNDTSTATSGELNVPQSNYNVRDEFNGGKEDYSGNDGAQNWVGDWVEVNDNNQPKDGNIKVVENQSGVCAGDGNFCVEFKTKDNDSIYREVDMTSAVGAISAKLTFDYLNELNDSAEVQVQESCDGGSNWNTLATFDENNMGSGSTEVDVTCTAVNTRIRFVQTAAKNDKKLYFDNVDISWELAATPDTETFTQGAPLVADLDLPATGVVTVTAYLDVSEGFIDLNNPPVPMTAIVRHDSPATTLLTLDDPTVIALLPPLLSDYEDTFPVKELGNGSTGAENWAPTPWEEENDNADLKDGNIAVKDDDDCPNNICLYIKTKLPDLAVNRQANLAGAVSAVWTYEYNNQLDGSGNVVVAEVSSNGVSYTPVYTHTGATAEHNTQDSVTIDITNYASTNTHIRYRVVTQSGEQELFVDNVRITYGVNQGSYLATWTGTIPSNTTIPSGSAIAVDVTSAVGGTKMNVLYDSEEYPSQVDLTVSSFINVDALAIYDAAYPGGSVITGTTPLDTVYIRATISDPFGTADITDMDLGPTAVGCDSENVTLDDSDIILGLTTASTKTYEHEWVLGNCTGDYLVTVSANEGTEGVTARKATPLEVLDNAEITIKKSPDSQQIVSGDAATFTIVVTNTGEVDLTNVSVSDPLAPNCDATIGTLTAPNGTHSYSCTLTNVTADFTNVATATGTPPSGPNVTDSDNAVVDVINPAITVKKSPDSQQILNGGTASFTIVVTNTGDVDLTNVSVSDPLAPNCDRTNLGTLTTPNGSTSYVCTLDNVTADFTNVATATGTPPVGPNVTDNDSAAVDVTNPAITVKKSPDTQLVANGGTATFTIVVTNTGDVDLTNVSVSDPLAPNCDRANLGTLTTPNGTTSYVCTLTNVTADFTNVITATGTPPVGPNVDDSDSADVDVPGPEITIKKSPDTQNIPSGGTASFTIVVTNTGDVDLTNVSVSDPLAPDCDATIGTLIAPNGTHSYSCTLTNVTAGFTNEATATGMPPVGPNVNDSDTADVTVFVPGTGLVDGTLYMDNDGSGSLSGGDTPLPGVRVTITDTNGVTYTVTSDASGYFSQTVPTGNTDVDVVDADLPAGVTLDSGSTDSTTVNVPDGGVGTDNTGYVVPGVLGLIYGTVYVDNDDSGDFTPGDEALPSVEVVITDTNGITYTVITDPDGYFSQLVPPGATGVGVVEGDLPPGFTFNGGTSNPDTINVPVNGAGFDPNGIVLADSTGLVQGTLYIDNDGSGSLTPGDTLLPNVDVVITDINNTVYTVTTDPDGYFSQVVPPGATDVDVDDADLPANATLDAGSTDPTTVIVPDGGSATDNTGYVLGNPDYTITKTVSGGGIVRTGDTITFTIRIFNSGDVDLTTIPLEDTYQQAYMSFVGASIEPDDNINDGTINWADLTAAPNHGTGQPLQPGQWIDVVVEFVGRLDTTQLNNSETVNTATGKGISAGLQTVPDKSDTAAVQIFNPTAILIAGHSVAQQDGVVTLGWETWNESEITGFNLYRVESEDARVKLNGQTIAAQYAGQELGAVYSFDDGSVPDGSFVSYQLELLMADGETGILYLGSVRIGMQMIFLPVVSNQ